MACGGCGAKRVVQNADPESPDYLKGGYKYLSDGQIRARLEVYKRRYCGQCDNKYKCDYTMYLECKKPNK